MLSVFSTGNSPLDVNVRNDFVCENGIRCSFVVFL